MLSSPAAWLVAAVLLLGGLAICSKWYGRAPNEPGSTTPNRSTSAIQPIDCRTASWKAAELLESAQTWSAAIAAWDGEVGNLPADDPCRLEAEHHLRLCRDGQQKAAGSPATGEPIAIPEAARPPKVRPEPIPEPTLEDEYPVGRTNRSTSAVQITGRGTNRAWGLQSEGHFDWRAQVDTTTRILESSPARGSLKVRQEFHNVSQLLVVRDKTFRLNPTPTLAQMGIQGSVDATLSRLPRYRVLRAGMLAYEQLDHQYRRLLTGTLRQLGQDRDDWVIPEGTVVAEQVERISGAVIEYEYLSGFGVTSIRLANADSFPMSQAELLRLADTLSLMLDYHVFPVRDRPVGEPWDVRVSDVAGLFAIQGMEAQASGTLTVQREAGEGKLVPLTVVSGAVDLQMESPSERQTARLSVIAGRGEFSLKDYFLSSADIELRINSLWQDPQTLLFNTDAVRDLKAKAVYRAENLTGSATTAAGTP